MSVSNFFLAKVRRMIALVMGRGRGSKMRDACFFLNEQETSRFTMKFLGLVEI